MKKVTKAVILAAGLGTRMLPATKSIPKELFPIVDKPALQYHIEECVKSGITSILIVVSRGKTLIEDHFDRSPELEDRLLSGGAGKAAVLAEVQAISSMADIMYVRQKEMNGTGNAVQMAKAFTGDEPFVVMYGDDVILGENPVTKQLLDAYYEYGKGVCGVQEVSEEAILKYSSLKVENLRDNYYRVDTMIEKPKKEEIYSLYSILGRLVLPANIYDILDKTPIGANNELQITDAMKILAETEKMTAVDFIGKRYDMGNKFSVMQAQVEVGVNHPEFGEDLKAYLKEFVKTL